MTRSIRLGVAFIIAALIGMTACTTDQPDESATVGAVGTPTGKKPCPSGRSNQPCVTTDRLAYGHSQSIKVTFAGAQPGGRVRITNQTGTPAYSAITPTGGASTGTLTFSPITVDGSYKAELTNSQGTAVLATTTFTVNSFILTTDKFFYTTAESILVTYDGMPTTTSPSPVISLALVGSADSSHGVQQSTNSTVSGTLTFSASAMAAGEYEARAYSTPSSNTVLFRSSSFVVATACTVPASKPALASITTGDLTLNSTTLREATASMSVPLDRSILFVSMQQNEPSPKYGDTSCELTAAGVHCTRDQPGTDTGTNSITVHYTVVTFTSGVSVQRGFVDTNTGNPATVTLTSAADMASSFVLLGGSATGGSGWGNNEFTQATLTDSTHLQITHTQTGSRVMWQVVTMTGATVQRGTAQLSSAVTSVSVMLPSSAPTGSFALASYTQDVSSAAAATLLVQTRLLNSTTLQFSRNAGGSNVNISWEVVSLPYATIPGLTQFDATVSTTIASTPGIVPTKSIALSSSQAILGQSTGSSAYQGAVQDLVGESSYTMTTDFDILTLSRGSSSDAATIPWTVIDFGHACDGSVYP